MSNSLHPALISGIQALGLSVPDDCAARLEGYLHLLAKWNRVYSLTAVRDVADMVALHIMDSLAVLPNVCGPRVLDVGTGPGLPGIPLALAAPELQICLLDSSQKKTRFLTQVLTELAVANAQVVTSRAEDYSASPGFDTVVSRAFGRLKEFVDATAHLCAPQGRMLAMKGRHPQDEIEALPAGFKVTDIAVLSPPGVRGDRCLVTITRR